ncbi:MAG: hypothetical protein K0U98_20855 [Deltaproteobacteria bacterium]|nr:hypothetical protein [Deltaproteobacteria bacterium]
MADLANTHVDPDSLVDLLWAAAETGCSEPLAHLIAACSDCYKPAAPSTGKSGKRGVRHFEDADVAALAANLLLHNEPRYLKILQHLLETCPQCHLASSSLFQQAKSGKDATPSHQEYEAISQRLSKRLSDWRSCFARDEVLAEKFLTKLLAMPAERRLLLVRNSERYGSWSLVTKLGESSREAVARNPNEAVSLASLAVEISKSLQPWSYDERVTEDIKAQAWALLGNALRVANDLKAAAEAFRQAEEFLQKGSGLDTVRVEVLDLKATLLAGQRRFDDARSLLGEALAVYRDIEDPHLQGRVMIKDALVCREVGNLEEAATILKEGLSLINPNREPRLAFVGQQNLTVLLVDLHRLDEAQERVSMVRDLAQKLDNPLDEIRTDWLEGRIHFEVGDFAIAEDILIRVKDHFLRASLPYDAALVSLELALIYSQEERLREMKFLALEILPVFARNEIHREALAAFTLFGRAAAAEEATAEVIRKTLGYLEQARNNPNFRVPRLARS